MSSPDRDNHPVVRYYLAFFETKFFPDLILLILWLTGSICSMVIPPLSTSLIRIIFVMPVILFIPGYSLIVSLFPGSDDLDPIERVALSVGLSLAIVPLIALCLNFISVGIRFESIFVSLILLSLILIFIGQYRRALLPEEKRYAVPFKDIYIGIREILLPKSRSPSGRLLSIILLISVIVAILTTLYVVITPKEGEKFSEFYILGEKKMAADYPGRMVKDLRYQMYIGIGNHEYRTASYLVEVHLLKINFDEINNTSSISRMVRIDQIPVYLTYNQSVVLPYNLTSSDSGYNLAEFLLFNETIPGNEVTGWDRINASYQNLHLWIKVSD